MNETDRNTRRQLGKCHVMGLASVCKATGLTEEEALASLKRLIKAGKASKKKRRNGYVVYSAYR